MKLKAIILNFVRKRKRPKKAVIAEGHTIPPLDLNQESSERSTASESHKPFTYSDPKFDLLLNSLRYTLGISSEPKPRPCDSETREKAQPKLEVNDHTEAMTPDVMNNFVHVVDEMKQTRHKAGNKTNSKETALTNHDIASNQDKTTPINEKAINSRNNFTPNLDVQTSVYHHALQNVQNVESFHSAMVEQPKLQRFYKPRRFKKHKSKRKIAENTNEEDEPTDKLSIVVYQKSLSQKLDKMKESIKNLNLTDKEEIEPTDEWAERSVINSNGNNGSNQKVVRFEDEEFQLEYMDPSLMKRMREKRSTLTVPPIKERESSTERMMVWTVRKI